MNYKVDPHVIIVLFPGKLFYFVENEVILPGNLCGY